MKFIALLLALLCTAPCFATPKKYWWAGGWEYSRPIPHDQIGVPYPEYTRVKIPDELLRPVVITSSSDLGPIAPEPSPLTLLGGAVVVFGCRRRSRNDR